MSVNSAKNQIAKNREDRLVQQQSPRVAKSAYVPDLAAFMSLCDANYAKLLRLLPYFEDRDERCFGLSRSQNDLGLIRITILERCKYTTMLRIEQGADIAILPPTQMEVRLYHDATMAEVTTYQGIEKIHQSYKHPNTAILQKDEKALCNEFLADWLSYCLKFGHGLPEEINITRFARGKVS